MNQEVRSTRVERRTSETDIELELCLDGSGESHLETGIGFFDHMLNAFSRHGLFDLKIECKGDLHIDPHHSVEDIGICLGLAIDRALAGKEAIQRYGHSYVPMDEALARAVVDLSGRSHLVFSAAFSDENVGLFPTTLVREFFQAVAAQGRMNLHIDLLRSTNDHHGIEAIFKAFARALDMASLRGERIRGVPSTKGAL